MCHSRSLAQPADVMHSQVPVIPGGPFEQAWQGAPSLTPQLAVSVATWLLQIARNTAIEIGRVAHPMEQGVAPT